MAEWRIRGYVADSDDEEGSQDVVQPAGVVAETASTSGDGTPEASEKDHIDNDEETLEASNLEGFFHTDKRVNSDVTYAKNNGSTISILNNVEQNRQSQDNEDLDELQADHYLNTSQTQLQAKLRLQAAELAPQPLRAPSSSLSSLSSCDQTSSPPRKSPGWSKDTRVKENCHSGLSGPDSSTDSESQIVTSRSDPPHSTNNNVTLEGYNRTARSLRHRNPIQLHPYEIEDERYRRVWKARGMKPVRIAQLEGKAMDDGNEESQNQEYDEEESQVHGHNDDPDDLRSSSQFDMLDNSNESAPIHNDIFEFEDDDLPNMDLILSDQPRKFVKNGYKRQKVGRVSFRMPLGMRRAIHSSSPTEPSIPADETDHITDKMPLSPPRSASQTSTETDPAVSPSRKSPQRTSNATMPTPVTSSEPRRPMVLEISEDDFSDGMSQVATKLSTSSERSGSEESSSTESRSKEVSHHLKRVQRKIRGVLPASWLKIDLKAQNKNPGKSQINRQSLSPERSTLQRGIARQVTASRSKRPDSSAFRNHIFSLSDSDDSGAENNHVQHFPRAQKTQDLVDESPDFLETRLGEAAEDDRIDAMLPSVARPRSRLSKPKQRKRQNNVSNFETHARPAGGDQSTLPRVRHSEHSSALGRKPVEDFPTKPYFRPPKLSILDAPSLNSPLKASVPAFLKIASRTVRSRNDRGRHSPSRKHLRLATRDDDEEANETLRTWREGTIAPADDNESRHRPARQPLYPRSGNSPYPSSQFSRTTGSNDLMDKPRTSPINHRSSTYKRRKLQSSLDHLVLRQPIIFAETKGVERFRERMEQSETRKFLASSIQAEDDLRPAMLESVEGRSQAKTTFQKDLSKINYLSNESGLPNVLRLLNEDVRKHPDTDLSKEVGPHKGAQSQKMAVSLKKPKKRKRRKNCQPKRMKPSVSWSRRSCTPTIIDDFLNTTAQNTSDLGPGGILTGLGPFGIQYTNDFGIGPLPAGMCFHERTFLGRGLLARSLKLNSKSALDSSRGHAVIEFQGQTRRWGPWNDAVSSDLGAMMAWISQASRIPLKADQAQFPSPDRNLAISTLEAIVTYFLDHLSFLDPVDRISCVQRCRDLITTLSHDLGDTIPTDRNRSSEMIKASYLATSLQLQMILAVFAALVYRISRDELVGVHLRDEVLILLQRIAQTVAKTSTQSGIGEFEKCVSRCQDISNTEHILRDVETSISLFVVAINVLPQDANSSLDLGILLQMGPFNKSVEGALDVSHLECHWNGLFTLLPFFEFDANGILEAGRRFKVSFDSWSLVKRLISPILEVSLKNPRGQPASFNAYLRALFRRCLCLINSWSWRRCESIIGTLFDYFARNQLAHLKNEESHGSPCFLEHLAENPPLAAESEDRCFHILLKIIGSGIKYMRQIYPEKKIRDIVWRLMPNHGRFHPKEEAIHQADLDALRNHHDLLCTLYWASPSSCRPRLTAIRNLVHLESSHREACHINIRAWFNLVKFQLSIEEPIDCLNGFRVWFEDLLEQLLCQHRLARTEAEDQVRSAQNAEGLIISSELLESTITKNQRQVEAILSDALVSLKLALDVARNDQAAAILVSPTLGRVFEMFDAGTPQITKPITQALEILSALANKSATIPQPKPHTENEDSQDYGDWPIFDDEVDASDSDRKNDVEPLLEKLQEPLKHLLSNSFGSDATPDDGFLLKLVDVWTDVAGLLVHNGTRSWNDYLDRFGSHSWYSLRDTVQTRKYTARFLATLIKKDEEISSDRTTFLLRSWAGCLVERESLLKFEYQLTEALLNAKCPSPLLRNLPFWTNTTSGRFEVSAEVFSERRISLISSVLSNMRESIENAVSRQSEETLQLRQEYKEMLKHLMTTMKHNYQALGQGSNLRGSYVNFAQKIVELLQQYTSNICPVDRFFTDNDAFPLPATDPTYVVGQLKNYALRLQEARTPKQLASFLQSVSERAAVDGQQRYFVNQLHGAMSCAFEDGNPARPTLRSFVVEAILPAYLETACTTLGSCCGWILALPYLQSLQTDFSKLLSALDGTDPQSVKAMTSILSAFLGSIKNSFENLLFTPCLLENTSILKLVSKCYSTTTSLLPVLDYVIRLHKPAQPSTTQKINFLKTFASFILSKFHQQHGHGDADDHHHFLLDRDNTDDENDGPNIFAETRNFITQELKDSLSKNWIYEPRDQQFFFSRGGVAAGAGGSSRRKEILVEIGLHEEEKAELVRVVRAFLADVEAMPALCEDDEDGVMWKKKKWEGGSDELIF